MSGDVVEHWFNSTKTYLHLRHFKPPVYLLDCLFGRNPFTNPYQHLNMGLEMF